ncbi:MAG: DUF3134 domain-containing protein [Pseudanabaenaceae cyanobacterium bins.68]|nr:DUF3134 domain-containing protein [Pseudanabaenaceae cyanobacterium bins.68]
MENLSVHEPSRKKLDAKIEERSPKIENPSLKEQPRNKPAPIVTSAQQVSILDWLESTGRLVPRDGSSSFDYREDVEELQELMVGDDGSYLEEEDDDDEPLVDDGDED